MSEGELDETLQEREAPKPQPPSATERGSGGGSGRSESSRHGGGGGSGRSESGEEHRWRGPPPKERHTAAQLSAPHVINGVD